MAGSINKVILVGNLGRDPEVRQTQKGDKVVSFSIATSETWTDRESGERKDRTEWHRVVIFQSGLAGVAERILHKGSKVYIEGQLRTRKYTNSEGREIYTTEVVLGPGSTLILLSGNGNGREDGSMEDGSAPSQTEEVAVDTIDDDIPF